MIHRFLYQDHTWAPFNIPESAMRKILTEFEVLPSFLNLICAFGHPQHHFDVDLPFGYHLRVRDTMDTVKDLGEWWLLQSDL